MKQWLDRMTGTITMYKLILFTLIAMELIALVLSLFGQLSYPPLALIASAVVAVAFTWGTSRVVSRLLRIRQHSESAIITALLILFIMQPKLDLLGLSGIALAGVVAGASKYLIAIRGRHIFNPAALGAFVPTMIVFTTFIGMSYGLWWIGTPLMQLPVYIGAFLILYRTQRLTVGVSFIVLAATLATVVAVSGGQAVGPAIQQVLLQSPIVFFAGFMLSEPLTLPPRRWQQLVEVVVVAFLFAVPLPIGPVSNSPLFALLVGNLIGFAFGQRRAIRLEFLSKRQIGPTTWELAFQPVRPVRFAPGQYMELTIPHRKADFRGSRRYFSISSAPTAEGPITFAITLPSKSSSFKQALLDLPQGAYVHGTSVGGDFVLPTSVDEPLLLVAGGIGVTPFASQLAYATERGEKRDVVVVYQNSAAGELPYSGLLEKSGVRVVLFAPEAPSPLPANWSYAGAGRVDGARLAEAVPDAQRRRAFISGPPALVSELKKALRTQGVRRVHSDYFSGY
ncbi:hypothetical protein BH10ACT7_BH10ACT7_06570 [soil metagenome]